MGQLPDAREGEIVRKERETLDLVTRMLLVTLLALCGWLGGGGWG